MGEFFRALAGAGRRIGSAGLDLLLPPHCPSCDSEVDAPGRFCAACFDGLGFLADPCCRRCGVPFARPGQGGVENVCSRCQVAPPPWRSARGAFRYDAAASRIILPLKYADRVENAAALATHMARAGAELLAEADVLVPVPLHRWRLFRRGYNQAALLAKAISRHAHRPVIPDALIRLRATASLQNKTAGARAAEMAGAIGLRPSRRRRISGRHVLLIDDVLTTGATARACTAALLGAGATTVDLLVAARVPDPRASDSEPATLAFPVTAAEFATRKETPMPEIEIYTQPWCPYCARALRLLQQKNVPFREIEAPPGSPARREAEQRSGRSSVPQIFVGGQHVGGCDDLMALERAGRLDALLQGE